MSFPLVSGRVPLVCLAFAVLSVLTGGCAKSPETRQTEDKLEEVCRVFERGERGNA
jgi:hypothetical protein